LPVVGAGHGNTGYDDGGGDSWELHGDTRLYRVRTKPLLQYFNQLAVCIRAFLGIFEIKFHLELAKVHR